MDHVFQNIHKRATDARASIARIPDAFESYEDGLKALLKLQVLQIQLAIGLDFNHEQIRGESAILILGLRLYTDELLTAIHKKFPCKQSGEPSSAGPSSAAPASTSTGAPPTSPAPNESAPTSGPA